MYQTIVPLASMRTEACVESEQVSQTYFGERLQVVHQQGGWYQIMTEDGYVGWVDASSVAEEKELFPFQYTCRVASAKANMYRNPSIYEGPCATVPFAARLNVVEKIVNEQGVSWLRLQTRQGNDLFLMEADTCSTEYIRTKRECVLLAESFLGFPYVWGGRSSLQGYDCSGFCQMLYREMGVRLPRDAKDQILFSTLTPVKESELLPCDLIFWENKHAKVVHVGFYLYDRTFIHATASIQPIVIRKNILDDPRWNRAEMLPVRRCFSIRCLQ